MQSRFRDLKERSAVPTRARELARHFVVSRTTAYRIIKRLAGKPPDAEALRLATTTAATGNGATRAPVAGLWPVEGQPLSP